MAKQLSEKQLREQAAQSREISGGFYISFDPRRGGRHRGFKITICDLETGGEH